MSSYMKCQEMQIEFCKELPSFVVNKVWPNRPAGSIMAYDRFDLQILKPHCKVIHPLEINR